MTAELIIRSDAGSRTAAFTRTGVALLAAIGLGLAAALAVAVDHRFSLLEPLKSMGRTYPYLLSTAVAIVLVCATTLVLSRHWLFERRFAAALVFVLAAGALSGVNLAALDAPDVAMLLVVGFWVAAMLVERHPIRLPLPLLLLILILATCSIGSIMNGGFGSLIAQRSFVNKCVLVLAMTSLVTTANLTDCAAKALAVIAVTSSILALGGMLIYLGTGLNLTAEDLSEYRFKETPLGYLPRATAMMPTTQSLGHLLLLGLGLVLFIPMQTWKRLAAALILTVGVGCTFSMGAYVTLTVILCLWPFLRWPEHTLHFLTLLMVVGVTAYFSGAAEWVYDSIMVPIGGKGALDRIGYLRAGIGAIEQHPVFGVGLRQIGRSLPTPVHNAYVQLTAEIGVPAGIAFFTLIASVTTAAGLAAFRRTSGRTQLLMKGFFLSMVALSIHLLFEPFYDNYLTWAFIGIVCGAVTGLSWRERRPQSEAPEPPDRSPWLVPRNGKNGSSDRTSLAPSRTS